MLCGAIKQYQWKELTASSIYLCNVSTIVFLNILKIKKRSYLKGLVGVEDVVDDVDCAPGPPHGFGSGSRFSVPRWGFSGVEPDSALLE